MNAKKIERRTLDCQLAIREAAQGDAKSESRTIRGTAIVFNAESQLLDDWGERFREVILPEAATQEWLDTQDIKMNMLHDRQLTVARCNKGTGSMKLWVDERGVNFEFDAPKCDIGDRCLEMVRRGDYSGCSFEFWPKDYDVDREGDEVKITHRSFEAIGALTIGLDPAYTQTSVNVREMAPKEEEEEKEEEPKEEKPEKPEETPKDEETPAEEKSEEDDNKEKEEREAVAVARMRQRRLALESDFNFFV